MALYGKGKVIGRLFKGNREIGRLYCGVKCIYEAVRSCFGSGIWRGDKPWSGKEKWNNGK